MQDNNNSNPADDSVVKSTKSPSVSPQRSSGSPEEPETGGSADAVLPSPTHDAAAAGTTPVRTGGKGRPESYRIPWQMKLSVGGGPTPALTLGISAQKVPIPASGGLSSNRHRRKLSPPVIDDEGDGAEKGSAKRRSLDLGQGGVHFKNPAEMKEMEMEHSSDVAGKEKEESEPSAAEKKDDDGGRKKKIMKFDLNEPPPSEDEEESF